MSDQATKAVAAKSRFRFYVYKLYEVPEVILYVGKGSGRRLKAQMRRHRLNGEVIKEFRCERDAFQFERKMIAAAMPELNKSPGGNGGTVRTKRRTPRKTADEKLMDKIGTRVYAARMLLRFDLKGLVDRGTFQRIREVAYGASL
jgi:hypothetical protein